MTYPLFLMRWLVRSGLARWLPTARRWTDGDGAFLHYLSDRVLTAPVEPLIDTAAWLEAPGADVLDLALGAPRFDLAPSGSTKLPADRRGWPPSQGLSELRSAVAEHLLAQHSLAASPTDEVLIAQGVTGAFSIVLDAFVNAGHRVVLFGPASPLYTLALPSRRARVRWVPTRVEEGRLRFRLDRLDVALRGARLLVVNSPANPTGGVIAAEDLEQIAWWCQRHDVLIFSDESYELFRYDGRGPSMGTFPRARQRTLTAGSVSKGYSLAAARVGWLAGSRPLIQTCTVSAALHTPFVPTLCQQVALAVLKKDRESFRHVSVELESRRQYAFERLQGMGLKPNWPAGGFFLWVPIAHLASSGRAFAEQLLKTKKVLVTPGELFGSGGEGHIRISYAAEDGRLREGLGRLGEFLRERQDLQPSPPRQQGFNKSLAGAAGS